MVRILYLIGLCALACSLWADESIVLQTGYRLSADRHEVEGATIRIFSNSGVTELPLKLVDSIEVVPPPAPVKPAPVELNLSVPAPVPVSVTPADLAETAARKYALPGAFVAGVMRTESGFNASAVSPKGAIGLMQLMPGTARDLGVDPKQPDQNADAGTRYLRDLLARYEGRSDQVLLALAAYNAGPAAVDKYHGVPPYRETREYILRVLKAWNPSVLTK